MMCVPVPGDNGGAAGTASPTKKARFGAGFAKAVRVAERRGRVRVAGGTRGVGGVLLLAPAAAAGAHAGRAPQPAKRRRVQPKG
eukprot:SAG11_NODE_234_length_11857_cov_15.265776_1_plen_84_part_00